MFLRDFTDQEAAFLDSVIGCMQDNERDKNDDEALVEVAEDIGNGWERRQELWLWTGCHWHLLECYIHALNDGPASADLEDVPPGTIVEHEDGEYYWSEAATGRLVRMFKAVHYRVALTARRYFTVHMPQGTQDDIVESS